MTEHVHRPRPPPNRRRDKIQLSCNPCRQRKLRCDRNQPCLSCTRRSIVHSCQYATTSSSAPDMQQPATGRHSTTLQGRVSELEGLVMTLMKGQSSLPTPLSTLSPASGLEPFTDEPSNTQASTQSGYETLSPDPGTLELRDSGTSYIHSAHWEAILSKIQGLKEDLANEGEASSDSPLFYGPNRHASRDEVLAAVPSRPIVDRLLALHFDSYIVTAYIIHSKKFLREYEAFWQDSTTTSIAWIGLMFSMLSISAQLHALAIDCNNGRDGSLKANYLAMKDAFREKTIQCLLLARYTAGGPYILEALIMILTADSILIKANGTDGWLSISVILQIATRMGFHRDPGHFPGLSPFEGEMRRRIWTTMLQLDLGLSLEMGLPRNATNAHIDTKEPQNLPACDFDEDTTQMPSSRPESEWTPVLALVARARLISALGLICDVITDVSPPSYDKVIKIDALLQDVHERAIPPVLRWESATQPITDSPNLVIQRVSIQTTYHKARILLYRRALIGCPGEKLHERDKESIRVCVDSAIKILSFQEMLHEESQPLGRLSQLRWKVTHIFNQDVLLATSVLCLYLQEMGKVKLAEVLGQTLWAPTAEQIRRRLTTSHRIWLQMSATSVEAGKVARALSIVLENRCRTTEDSTDFTSYDFLSGFDASASFNDQNFPSGFYSPLTFFDNILDTYEIPQSSFI